MVIGRERNEGEARTTDPVSDLFPFRPEKKPRLPCRSLWPTQAKCAARMFKGQYLLPCLPDVVDATPSETLGASCLHSVPRVVLATERTPMVPKDLCFPPHFLSHNAQP
jgi:hypothetical protein